MFYLAFFSLYTLACTSVGLTGCISIVFFSFENVESFDHYTACWFPLIVNGKAHIQGTLSL